MTKIIFGLIILAFTICGVNVGEWIKGRYGRGVWAGYFLVFTNLSAFFLGLVFFNSGWGG